MSTLEFKPDWDQTKQRYEAWWRREKMERPMLWVAVPRDDAPDIKPPTVPDGIEARWTDLEFMGACAEHGMRTTRFMAESLPVISGGYPGHVAMPTFYGCPFALAETTGWHDPILTGEKLDISALRVDRECKWWKFGDRMFAFERDFAAGRCLPAMGAIFGLGDTLGMLRGNGPLLYDLMDDPEGVRDAELRLMDDWFDVFEHQTGILTAGGGEYATWFPIWAPGKFYPTQCDVSYGISPRSFRECYVPALRKWTEYLDHALYHLDGIGAFHLLDEICSVDGVEAVQVLPGSGKPSPLHYMDTLKAVQRHGRGLHIMISPDEIPRALENLSSRGLFIHTWASSEAEGKRIVEDAERLSVDRG